MKYIRTKNRIFQDSVPNQEKESEILLKCYQDDFGKDVKIADTIEELCDCWDFFDSIYNEYKTKEICLYTLNNMKVSLERKCVRDVKLCIRTDKGLIYVAKMNGKGELVLL